MWSDRLFTEAAQSKGGSSGKHFGRAIRAAARAFKSPNEASLNFISVPRHE